MDSEAVGRVGVRADAVLGLIRGTEDVFDVETFLNPVVDLLKELVVVFGRAVGVQRVIG